MGGDEPDNEEERRRGLEEAAAAFSHEVTLETYLAVHDEVLRRFAYRCAITGMQFAPAGVRPHPDLDVVPIRPLDRGGPLHASNFLPLIHDAAKAFSNHHVIVGYDFEIWADLSRIDPELQERVVPLGRLVLPKEPAVWPDAGALRWHREQVLGSADETT